MVATPSIPGKSSKSSMNRKITNQHYQQAFYYSILGIMCLILAYMVQGPGWLTIYPAMSCLLVGSAYGKIGRAHV